MKGQTSQIVALAKRGWDAEAISTAMGLKPEDVLLILTQDTEAKESLNSVSLEEQFKAFQHTAVLGVQELATTAENEGVRMKAYQYILDTIQGKNRPKQIVINNNSQNNYQLIVERLEQAKAKRAEINEGKLIAV